MNLDEYADVGTHWIALYGKNNEVVYFDSFGIEHVPKEIKYLLDIKASKQTYLEYKQTIQFNNVRILLHWVHIFYVCRKKFD